jgi:hypothetical protein
MAAGRTQLINLPTSTTDVVAARPTYPDTIDQDGEIIRLHGIALPWRLTFTVGAQREPLVLNAQRKGGGDAGPVTCTITVNGKLRSSTTAHGKYASAQCHGSG